MNLICKKINLISAFLMILILSAGILSAEEKNPIPENIRNIVPYLGVLRSEYKTDDSKVDDKSVMKGLYLQWINPQLFQVNTFIYGSDDVFNESFIGFHIMGDWYIKHPLNGKYALGAGFEYLKPDAKITIDDGSTNTEITIKNNFYIPYVRAGRYFDFDIGTASSVSIFHWTGYQLAISRGDGETIVDLNGDFPPLPFTSDFNVDNETSYVITGLKLGLNLMHVIDLSLKYKAVMNSDDFFNVIDAMGNFYFTRNMGISLRHKYSENETGNMDYTIFGAVYSF